MSQLVIEDLEFFEVFSNQVNINGGFSRSGKGPRADLDADLDADVSATLHISGSLAGGHIKVFARGSGAAAAASAATVNGRASASAYAQA